MLRQYSDQYGKVKVGSILHFSLISQGTVVDFVNRERAGLLFFSFAFFS